MKLILNNFQFFIKKSEGIPIDLIEFSDNSPVLDLLLSRPLGLLSLIDEENRFPKSSDRTLIGNTIPMHR